MKTFQEFILEAERPVNKKQMFPMDTATQENLRNAARRMGPGGGSAKVRPGVQPLQLQKPVKFSLVPANIPMK
jgi:hypothetical protein